MKKIYKLFVSLLLLLLSFIPVSAKSADGIFETQASLRLQYDVSNQFPRDIDIRFGTALNNISSDYEYGIIILSKSESARFSEIVDKSTLDVVKKEGKAISGTPVIDGDVYRLAWVITNAEENLDLVFSARAYRLNKATNKLELANSKEYSVRELALKYINENLVSGDAKLALEKICNIEYYEYSNLEFIDAATAWPEINDANMAASGNIKAHSEVGSFIFESTDRAFQYEKKDKPYKYDNHYFNHLIKTGGETGKTRYIKISPKGDASFKMWASIGKGTFSELVYFTNTLDKPNPDDPNSFVHSAAMGKGNTYSSIEVALEGGKDYYMWFLGQSYIRGMRLDSNIKARLNGIILDLSNTKLEFKANDAFSYDGLIAYANIGDGKDHLISNFSVISPDMTTPGEKLVTVKYGKFAISSYKIKVV